MQGGINLSSERDETRLLDSILTGAMEIAGADGGILYVRTGENILSVSIVRANSLGIYFGGTGGNPDNTRNTLRSATGMMTGK